jgi:hypothetical protein
MSGTVHIVKVGSAVHAFADIHEAYAFYAGQRELPWHDEVWFHGEVNVWPKGDGPDAMAERDMASMPWNDDAAATAGT